MDVAVFAVILLGLAAYVAAPLYGWGEAAEPTGPGGDDDQALQARLRELDLDLASGLLTPADHERERAALLGEAERRSDPAD